MVNSVTIYPATCAPSHRMTGVRLLAALNTAIRGIHKYIHWYPQTHPGESRSFFCGDFRHNISCHMSSKPWRSSGVPDCSAQPRYPGHTTTYDYSCVSTGNHKLIQPRVGASSVVISVTIYPATCPPSHRTAVVSLYAALNTAIRGIRPSIQVCPLVPANSLRREWELLLW